MDIYKIVNEKAIYFLEDMISIRRHIHQNPETSCREYETKKYIENIFERKGIGVKGYESNTGSIVDISGSVSGKTFGIRADMDALNIEEKTEADYKSIKDGVMHACGHDGHIAMTIGAALILNEIKDELNGRVRFIFQPAEEQFGGAKKMIAEGALENPNLDAVIALHLWPDLNKGTIGIKDGCIMASNDKFEVKIKGKGGHGAMPHKCVDAIVAGCQFISSAQSIISREIDPLDSAVITFGTFNSGTSYNIVSSETIISGTVRTVDEKTRDFIEKRLKYILYGMSISYNIDFEFNYIRQYPPTINNSQLNAILEQSALSVFGNRNVLKINKPYMTAEDFAYYGQKIPGAIYLLGTCDEVYKYPLHSDKIDLDEDRLASGAAFLAMAAINYLNL